MGILAKARFAEAECLGLLLAVIDHNLELWREHKIFPGDREMLSLDRQCAEYMAASNALDAAIAAEDVTATEGAKPQGFSLTAIDP